jgi:flagellar biosynthesis protein FlhG
MNNKLRIIAVTSGKGGTGKTCIAANLGIALASQGKRVVLFDADLQLANLDIVLGIKTPYNLQHVVNEERSLREILFDALGNIRVVTGGSAIPSLVSAGPRRLATFMSQIDDLARDTDILLFDTRSGIDGRVVPFLAMAHQAIVVTTPDPSSVTDAYATIKVATKSAAATELGLLVNMVSSGHEANGIHGAMNKICQTYLGLDVPLLGYLHTDADIAHSMRKRQPFVSASPHSRAAREIQALATSVSAGFAVPRVRVA